MQLFYSHGQELFYKFVSIFTNKIVKQLLSMTVCIKIQKDSKTVEMKDFDTSNFDFT